MARVFLAQVALLAALFACATPLPDDRQPVPLTPSSSPVPSATAAPTASATAEATAADVQTLTIQAIVYIREKADANSKELGSLTTGETVKLIDCGAEWCNVTATIDDKDVTGWVWRGCTSDPAELRCEARP